MSIITTIKNKLFPDRNSFKDPAIELQCLMIGMVLKPLSEEIKNDFSQLKQYENGRNKRAWEVERDARYLKEKIEKAIDLMAMLPLASIPKSIRVELLYPVWHALNGKLEQVSQIEEFAKRGDKVIPDEND